MRNDKPNSSLDSDPESYTSNMGTNGVYTLALIERPGEQKKLSMIGNVKTSAKQNVEIKCAITRDCARGAKGGLLQQRPN